MTPGGMAAQALSADDLLRRAGLLQPAQQAVEEEEEVIEEVDWSRQAAEAAEEAERAALEKAAKKAAAAAAGIAPGGPDEPQQEGQQSVGDPVQELQRLQAELGATAAPTLGRLLRCAIVNNRNWHLVRRGCAHLLGCGRGSLRPGTCTATQQAGAAPPCAVPPLLPGAALLPPCARSPARTITTLPACLPARTPAQRLCPIVPLPAGCGGRAGLGVPGRGVQRDNLPGEPNLWHPGRRRCLLLHAPGRRAARLASRHDPCSAAVATPAACRVDGCSARLVRNPAPPRPPCWPSPDVERVPPSLLLRCLRRR